MLAGGGSGRPNVGIRPREASTGIASKQALHAPSRSLVLTMEPLPNASTVLLALQAIKEEAVATTALDQCFDPSEILPPPNKKQRKKEDSDYPHCINPSQPSRWWESEQWLQVEGAIATSVLGGGAPAAGVTITSLSEKGNQGLLQGHCARLASTQRHGHNDQQRQRLGILRQDPAPALDEAAERRISCSGWWGGYIVL